MCFRETRWLPRESGKTKRRDRRSNKGSFDVVVTNPPFGGLAHIDDPHTLSRFELPALETKDSRRLMPAEQLFVEGALKYVKHGGFLVIVLPRSIANNPGLKFIRRWLLCNTRIVASIDLPKETFAEGGGVPNPSVLIMQRLTREEAKLALPCTRIQGWTNQLSPCSVTAWSTRTRYYRPFVGLSRKLASSGLWRRRR